MQSILDFYTHTHTLQLYLINMKHLLICCLVDENCFASTIVQKFISELNTSRKEILIRNLYDPAFKSLLSKSNDISAMHVKREQDLIRWADIITFIYPIWWSGMPAILKSYLESVFISGFAYTEATDSISGLLSDKKVNVINLISSVEEIIRGEGIAYCIPQSNDFRIFEWCGMEVQKHLFFRDNKWMNDEEKKELLSDLSELMGEKSHNVFI